MSKLSPARKAALDVLMEARGGSCYARDILAARVFTDHLDARDAAFAARLALGVTATEGTLDELLDRYLAKPHKVAPRVRSALRISTFEMLYLETPGRVAVSQGVELVRQGAKSAAGLANAVLRKVSDNVEWFRDARDVDDAEPHVRSVASVSRSFGLPYWLGERLLASYGDEAAGTLALASNLEPAPIALHLNARIGGDGSYAALFGDEIIPGCVATDDVAHLVAEGVFERADAVASDLNAQLIATVATRPGSCLEIGAGRGTKTFILACQARRVGYERNHVALDLFARKCDQNQERLYRAGIESVRTVAGDACDLDTALASLDVDGSERLLFDTVFVDAPCSGTGTMRRHPEIPWRLKRVDVDSELPELQLKMLKEASSRVAPHGELVYATCSIMHQENVDVVDAFLESPEGEGFEIASVSAADTLSMPGFEGAREMIAQNENTRGLFQSLPRAKDGYDGHFCARLVKH